ncbi:hypothetical protein BURKHO8Y_520093 [Burkholderia sp. 8Y]|nr:hypothetical protein BURKHO8Y_520093 [Burkholderia sp. 8Y]
MACGPKRKSRKHTRRSRGETFREPLNGERRRATPPHFASDATHDKAFTIDCKLLIPDTSRFPQVDGHDGRRTRATPALGARRRLR